MFNKKSCRMYFELNKYVSNLKKVNPLNKTKKKFFENPDSLLSIIVFKIYIFFKCIVKFFLELIVGCKYLINLFFLKKKRNKNYAMILGNGPSLDLLKIKDLKKISYYFDIFVVNNFLENKIFNRVIPNFFVASDPVTFTEKNSWGKKKIRDLIFYLKKNKNINILCPVLMCKSLENLFGFQRLFGFIDVEARNLYSNTLPFLPRGYSTSTVLKSISIANWMGYKKIFILGVDNTYPRDLFVNKKNHILNLENHSKSKDYVYDMTHQYESVHQVMFDLYKLFKDFKKINKKNNIYNLYEYSLTGYNKSYNIKKLIDKLSKKKLI